MAGEAENALHPDLAGRVAEVTEPAAASVRR